MHSMEWLCWWWPCWCSS